MNTRSASYFFSLPLQCMPHCRCFNLGRCLPLPGSAPGLLLHMASYQQPPNPLTTSTVATCPCWNSALEFIRSPGAEGELFMLTNSNICLVKGVSTKPICLELEFGETITVFMSLELHIPVNSTKRNCSLLFCTAS